MASATDVNAKEGKTANGEVPQRKMRANPVALEVPVSVAGARPIASKDKRELFTEETTTVLVFKDGAVIQLSAAVAVGQLLFLTEKRSKKEVVCQVVHKRSHRPTVCFVEVEFTEPEENFWGVSFPTQADSAQVPAIAEAVEAEETTEDDRNEPLAAPKSEDVAQLKDEVTALKEQLQELRGKQTSEDKDAVARRLAEAEAAARSAAEIEARQKAEEEARKKAERAKAESGSAPATEIESKQRAEGSVAPATIGMRLPIMGAGEPAPAAPAPGMPQETVPRAKEEIDPLEDLLPRPALDFSRAPKHVDPNDPFNIYRPEKSGAGKREILVGGVVLAVIVLAGVGAWYKNKLPFLHRAPKTSVTADAGTASKPASTTGAESGTNGQPTGNVAGAPVNTSEPNVTNVAPEPARPAAAGTTLNPPAAAPTVIAPVVPPPIESPAERAALAEKGRMRVVAPAKSGTKKATAEQPAKNHGKAQTSAQSAPVPVAPEVYVSDQPVVPAKLLRAVQPIYPPDAMRNYITGDVRIEAEVDKQGRIGAMKILLGPKQFRQVAMDALKQYEYAPATQGGRPVPSKVTVTIKFWFDP
ncbi:MAG TPA: TonB family protein [Candidatus Sulfotelmatobacter sp.]|nr:TonB family protein [Candidatus Sulfotelmatobacter sp.]